MVFVRLTSRNPEASWVLGKNPESPPLAMPIRSGSGMAFYRPDLPAEEGIQYGLWFRDGTRRSSYGGEMTYLNSSQFTSPVASRQLLTEFLNTAMSRRHEKDVPASQKLEVSAVDVTPSVVKLLERMNEFLPDLHLEVITLSRELASLTLTTSQSLYQLLNGANLILSFLVCYQDLPDSFALCKDQAFLEKMVRSMQVLKPDYYLSYLINSRLFRSRETFQKHRPTLEQIYEGRVRFQYGNTAQQRLYQIKSTLSGHYPVIDLGCGEGFYLRPMRQKMDSKIPYYGVDPDPKERAKFQKKMKHLEDASQVQVFPSLEGLLVTLMEEGLLGPEQRYDVIISEVIEHMGVEQSQELVNQVLEKIPLANLILTTPNREFNVHYRLKGFRHEDHQYELTRAEFDSYLAGLKIPTGLTVEKWEIGDRFDELTPTQGVHLYRPS